MKKMNKNLKTIKNLWKLTQKADNYLSNLLNRAISEKITHSFPKMFNIKILDHLLIHLSKTYWKKISNLFKNPYNIIPSNLSKKMSNSTQLTHFNKIHNNNNNNNKHNLLNRC